MPSVASHAEQPSNLNAETPALPYRLILLDVDGTLVGATHTIAPRTLASLKEVQERGCTLVLSTGRSRHTAQPVVDQIGGHGYGILFSGAVVLDWHTGAVIQKSALPPATAVEATRLIRAFELAPICEGMEEDDLWLNSCGRFPLPELYAELNAHRMVYPDDLEVRLVQQAITVAAYGPAEKVRPLAQACREAFGATVNVIESASKRYDCWCVEVYPAEINKARAAQAVADLLGVPREQTLAIGDHLNDLELLRWAAVGVCMGDGHPDAKASAQYVTGSLDEDGVAQALNRFVLGAC